jgi:hypothetical protein
MVDAEIVKAVRRVAMRALLLIAILVPTAPAQAERIELIRVEDGALSVTLRANGSADYSYRGNGNGTGYEDRVGLFHAKLDPREFGLLTAMPAAARFDELEGFYLPYSTHIVRTTIIRDGKTKTLERHDRGLRTDPVPPVDLWSFEMAVRGLATQLQWEPASSGIRVSMAEKGNGIREIMVREAGTNFGVAVVRPVHTEVDIPIAPGNYVVIIADLQENHWETRATFFAHVAVDNYQSLRAEKQRDGDGAKKARPDELIIQTPNGWWLHCVADGSGSLGRGPSLDASCRFKAGTIDFSAAVADLERVTKGQPAIGRRFFGQFCWKDGSPPEELNTKDVEVVGDLFAKAAKKERSEVRGDQFDALWREHSPSLEDH